MRIYGPGMVAGCSGKGYCRMLASGGPPPPEAARSGCGGELHLVIVAASAQQAFQADAHDAFVESQFQFALRLKPSRREHQRRR